MADWWLPEDGFTATVRLTWRRTAFAADEPSGGGDNSAAAEPLTDEIKGVKWIVRGGAHWLTYQEEGAGRTTLVVTPDELKWLRFGDISWQHTFTVGQKTTSALQVGVRQLPVEMDTLAFFAKVQPEGGHIRLIADMVVDGSAETLQTELNFSREEPDGAKPASS